MKEGETMTDKKTSAAQLKALRNWEKRNKDKAKYYNYKSRVKTFVNQLATDEDLNWIIELAEERQKELREEKTCQKYQQSQHQTNSQAPTTT